jgi:hypothetical protein
MTIISEAGWDMSKWKTEDHFVSWLRLCPDNRISGNKVIGKGRLPTNNPISIALKMAASTLRLSNTYLGAQFRRFRTRLGAPVAVKAMAAKLARFAYRMLRYGTQYVDKGAALYHAQHQQLRQFIPRHATPPWLQSPTIRSHALYNGHRSTKEKTAITAEQRRSDCSGLIP